MIAATRAWLALAALAAILAITAAWWALALWPVGGDGPEWVLVTREVCFGSTADGLPTPGGWLLLAGQPLGMVGLLAVIWGAELRAGLGLAMRHVAGQIALGAAAALIVAGVAGVVVRVRAAGQEPFWAGGSDQAIATQLTRLREVPPAMALVDQHGRDITLAALRGRPVIVAFAFAHCETVCPLIVSDVLTAQRRLEDSRPVVLVVTLDPWRDTPSRLGAIADRWKLGADAHVLSGPVEQVERTLNAWRIPRVRNQRTGDLTHPSIAYVIGADGRIAYALGGSPDAIVAAVKAL